jgi:hypothetical protein
MKLKFFVSGRKFAKSLQYMQHKYYTGMTYGELKDNHFGMHIPINDTIRINLQHIYEWFIDIDTTILAIESVLVHEVLHHAFKSEREPGDIYQNFQEEEMIEEITGFLGLITHYNYEELEYKW